MVATPRQLGRQHWARHSCMSQSPHTHTPIHTHTRTAPRSGRGPTGELHALGDTDLNFSDARHVVTTEHTYTRTPAYAYAILSTCSSHKSMSTYACAPLCRDTRSSRCRCRCPKRARPPAACPTLQAHLHLPLHPGGQRYALTLLSWACYASLARVAARPLRASFWPVTVCKRVGGCRGSSSMSTLQTSCITIRAICFLHPFRLPQMPHDAGG